MTNELFTAVVSGDVETVRALVREDPSLASARDGRGLPVVLLALFNRQREAIAAPCAAKDLVRGHQVWRPRPGRVL